MTGTGGSQCGACAGGDAGCLPKRLSAHHDPAGAGGGGQRDVISVAPGIHPGGFTIGKNVTVTGSGAGQTTVKGTGRAGVGITVAQGVTTAIEALTVDAAAAPLNQVTGDAVYNFGTMTVRDAAITGSNNNGALFNQGLLTVDHTTISGNQTSGVVRRATLVINSVARPEHEAGHSGLVG